MYEHTLELDPAPAARKVRSLRYTGPTPPEEGFGTTMQMFLADKYLGKRVRFSASVRTLDVEGWAGLWMRVDVWVRVDGMSNRMSLAFDNMQDRPIRATTDWTDYAVVLDTTSDAKLIALGILLTGPGQVWMRDARFEVVELDVPTTGVPQLLPDFME